MRTLALVSCCLALALLALSGCQSGRPGPGHDTDQSIKRAPGQTITTLLDRSAQVERADSPGCDYPTLLGAYGKEGAREGKALYDAFDTGKSPANIELQSGWIYIVRPPAWPIVRTPRIRGGTPLGTIAGAASIHLVAYADGNVERIFFLGAFDAAGNPVNTSLHVEADGAQSTGAVDLSIGQYAEVTLSPTATPAWGTVTIGAHPFTDPACPQEIRDFIRYVRQRALNSALPWNNGLAIP